MKHRIRLFFSSFFLFSVSRALNLCPTIDEFESNNKEFMSKEYNEYKEQNKGNFIKYITETSKVLSSGAFGTVYDLKGSESIAIKKLPVTDEKTEKNFLREIKTLRTVCGHSVKEYKKLTVCRSHAIAAFVGCIFDKKAIYIFLEKMSFDLSTDNIQLAYRALSHFDRLRIMLDIIDRFIEFHETKFVHSDIKPQNIMMKNDDFTDFRIIDLGMSNREGDENFIGATPSYLPNEMFAFMIGLNKFLFFQNDIFALGKTFTEMEGDSGVKDKALLTIPNVDAALSNAFHDDKKLSSILPEIKLALNSDRQVRFKTMKEFSDALVKKLQAMPGYKEYLKTYFSNLDNRGCYDDFKSYWRSNLGSSFAPPKRKAIKEQQSSSRDSPSSFDRIIPCSSSKKNKTGKQNLGNQPNNNDVIGQNQPIFII